MQHPIKNEECLRDFFFKKNLIRLSNRKKKKNICGFIDHTYKKYKI